MDRATRVAESAFLRHLLKLDPDLTTGYSFTSLLGTIEEVVGFARGMPRDEFVTEANDWLKTQNLETERLENWENVSSFL